MKFKFFLIPILVFAFACQNTPKEKSQENEPVTEEPSQEVMVNAQKIELQIEGMTCTGCENAIQKTIDEFEGVYTSKADHEKGIAIVELDSTKVDILKVKDAINELGYEAKEHHMLTE
ncbi:MAG: cation transporter [Bacteroidetes bacterium]|nr:cation transporter [Bacteroidota bacterium]